MKFSQRTFNHFILLLGLGLGTTARAAEKKSKAAWAKEIEELEHQEFLDSANLETKEHLARAYWCSGNKGLAVEKWLWLNQFFRNHPRRKEWRSRLESAEKTPKELTKALDCSV